MPSDGLRLSRKSGSALLNVPYSSVFGRAGGGNKCFANADGTDNAVIIDGVMIESLCDAFDLKYRDQPQLLRGDTMIYSSNVISTRETRTPESIALHWFDGSWIIDKGPLKQRLSAALKKKFPRLFRFLLKSTGRQ